MEVVALLGLAAALGYGTSDFFGGLASRRSASSLGVVALFTLVALVVFAAVVPLMGERADPRGVSWGAIAGVAIGMAYITYFRGLAVGRMGVVATVAAIWAAVVPLLTGLALGERPDALAWIGIAAIIVAIALVTYPRRDVGSDAPAPDVAHGPEGRASRPLAFIRRISAAGVAEGSIAGVWFGLFFVALGQAGNPSGALAWPLLSSAAGAAVVVGTAAVLRGISWTATARQWRAIIAAGICYAAGSWAFVAGVSRGLVAIVAVLAALSPVPTMLLARLVLTESLVARQYAGVVLALAGVALITFAAPG